MSLLLDALKAAENLKRTTHSGPASGTQPAPDRLVVETAGLLSLEEDSVPASAGKPGGATPLHPPAAAKPSAPAGVAAPPRARTRASRSTSRQPLLVGLLIGITLLLAGAWWYLTPREAPLALIKASMPIPVPPATPATPESAGVVTAFTLAPATATPRQVEARPAEPTASPPLPTQPTTQLAAATAPPATSPVIISTQPSPLLAAYAAFLAGDLARAEGLYQQALATEPQQPDAHLGLAVIAQSRGDRRSALSHYREVIEATPDHPRAWAGIADLSADSDLAPMESRLRGLLASRPTAALHFSLGNILMRQRRWPEAQESYFEASAAAPTNADYVFNLAVALDHLGKGQAASNHYEQAITLATNPRAVQFDVIAAQHRLTMLRQGTK